MLTRLRDNRRIRKLTQIIRKAAKQFTKDAQAEPDQDRRYDLYNSFRNDASIYEDEIAELRSTRLVETAHSLDLPVPPATEDSGHWQQSSTLRSWSLTNLGITELRKAIRQETRERREVWLSWTGMAVSILSLVVAILALLGAPRWFEGRQAATIVATPHAAPAPASSGPLALPIAPHT